MGNATINLTEPQSNFYKATERVVGCVAGMGCLHPATKIITKQGLVPICDITSPTQVLSWSEKDQKFVFSLSGRSYVKDIGPLLRISTNTGEFAGAYNHRILSSSGEYLSLVELSEGDKVMSAYRTLMQTNSEYFQKLSHVNDLHLSQKDEDFLSRYSELAYQYGQLLLFYQDIDQFSPQEQACAQELSRLFSYMGDLLELRQEYIHHRLFSSHGQNQEHLFQKVQLDFYVLVNPILENCLQHKIACNNNLNNLSLFSEYLSTFLLHHKDFLIGSLESKHQIPSLAFDTCTPPFILNNLDYEKIISINEEKVNAYYDIQVIETNNYVTEDGSIHHNSGKTRTLLTRCVSDLIKYKCNVGYFAPTVPLIRDIAYPVFSDIFEEMGMKYIINKSENIIYTGFGKIFCKSMEIPERIIGLEIKNAFLDEYDILPISKAKLAFNKIAARCRLKPDGNFSHEKNANQIFIATTPEGHKATYEMFVKNKLDNSRLIKMSTYSNQHNLPPGYIEGLISQYPTNLIEAYLNGEFKNLNADNVYQFNRDSHLVHQTKPSLTETLHIGQDFNVGQMASVVLVARNNRAGGRVWLVIDELTQGRDTPDTIDKLKERYPRNHIIMYPDASGRNRSSKNFSKSDHTLLRQAGFQVRVSSKNPLIKDRVASVNNAFSKNKLFISDECISVIESLEQQAYDKDGMPEKGSVDHLNDALGYFCNKAMPVATSLMRYEAVSHL